MTRRVRSALGRFLALGCACALTLVVLASSLVAQQTTGKIDVFVLAKRAVGSKRAAGVPSGVPQDTTGMPMLAADFTAQRPDLFGGRRIPLAQVMLHRP